MLNIWSNRLEQIKKADRVMHGKTRVSVREEVLRRGVPTGLFIVDADAGEGARQMAFVDSTELRTEPTI
jgi:hypothetical protein